MKTSRRPGLQKALTAVLIAAALLPVACCGEPTRNKQSREKYWGPRFKQWSKEQSSKGAGGGTSLNLPGTGPTALVSDPTKGVADLDAAVAGAIKGVIKFPGTVRPPRIIDLSKDKFCQTNYAGKVKSESLLVDANGHVKDVMVYISSGLNGLSFPPQTKRPALVQDGCFYTPHVLVLRAGEAFNVVNKDDTSHNYHFFGQENGEINKSQTGPMTNTVYIDNPEIGAIFKCDYHPWMLCNVHILTHQYHFVTRTDGTFEIKGVPPGKYQVSFHHEMLSVDPIMVTVGDKETKDLGVLNAVE